MFEWSVIYHPNFKTQVFWYTDNFDSYNQNYEKHYRIFLFGYPIIDTQYDNFLPQNLPSKSLYPPIDSEDQYLISQSRIFGRVAVNANALLHEARLKLGFWQDHILSNFTKDLARYILKIQDKEEWPKKEQVDKIITADRIKL